MLILWAWTAVLSGFVLFPLFIPSVNAIIPFGAAALGVGLYTLFHPGLRRRDSDDRSVAPPAAGTGGPRRATAGLGRAFPRPPGPSTGAAAPTARC